MPRRIERAGKGADWLIPPCHCPACLHQLNAAGHLADERPPKPGDFTVCIECATVLEFTPLLTLALADPAAVAADAIIDPAGARELADIIAAVKAIPASARERDRRDRRRN